MRLPPNDRTRPPTLTLPSTGGFHSVCVRSADMERTGEQRD
jgi:hypothetical protein